MICASITPTSITPTHLLLHTYNYTPHTPIPPPHLLPPHLSPPPPQRQLEGVRNATRSVLSTSLDLQTDFSELEALVDYEVTVQAVNNVGTGPLSTGVVFNPRQGPSE